jgi:hypothetical protein
MARRTGSADLPLHRRRVPQWLATRMSSLESVITQAIVHHYVRDEFLRRLSHPFWFQSFGAVMGMDWPFVRHHASGGRMCASSRRSRRLPHASRPKRSSKSNFDCADPRD